MRSYFWGKEISSFLMIQEILYASAIFLERSSFQNIWKIKIWFFVQCDEIKSKDAYEEFL